MFQALHNWVVTIIGNGLKIGGICLYILVYGNWVVLLANKMSILVHTFTRVAIRLKIHPTMNPYDRLIFSRVRFLENNVGRSPITRMKIITSSQDKFAVSMRYQ